MATGVITGSGVAWAAQMRPGQAVAFMALTSVCALLPDFDHPNATLPRKFRWPGRALAWVIGSLFGHRGLTHSVLGVGLLGAVLPLVPQLPPYCYWAVILGCVTHIAGDMLTMSGVPLLWPSKRCFRLGRIRTGGFFETQILTPVLAVAASGAAVGMMIGAT